MTALSSGALRALTPDSGLARIGGMAGLGAVVGGSFWIATGAAGDERWLELPGASPGSWVTGPLRGAGLALGGLPDGSLSVALLLLGVGYLLALVCAASLSPRAVLSAVMLAALAFTLAPSLVSSDVYGYIAYARESAGLGLDPYVSPPLALGHDAVLPLVYWRHQASPYGPLFTLLSVPVGWLPVAVAFWILKVATGAAAVLLALLIGRLAAGRGLCPARAVILVALNPIVLVYAVSGAHNDLLGGLLVVAGLSLGASGRGRAAGAALICAAGIKLTFGLALPFLIFATRHGRAVREGAVGAAALLGAVTLVLFGLHPLDQLHRIATDPLFDTEWSGPDLLSSLLGSPIDGPVRLAGSAAAALAAILMLWRTWKGGDALTCAGWAFLALLASIASLAPWYLVWWLPLAALARGRILPAAAVLSTAYMLAVHLPLTGGHLWLSPPSGTVPRSVALRAPGVSRGDPGSAGHQSSSRGRDLKTTRFSSAIVAPPSRRAV